MKKSISEIGLEGFFIAAGLYKKIAYDVNSVDDTALIERICGNEIRIDGFCAYCKSQKTIISGRLKEYQTHVANLDNARRSTYVPIGNHPCRSTSDPLFIKLGYNTRSFICSKCNQVAVTFWFKVDSDFIMKTGQYPSLADLSYEDINKYKKVLLDEDISEIKRGLGLHANGIGAGAFVYLRRVFESQVEEAYKNCINDGRWDSSLDFSRIDMKIKIDKLKDYLPAFLHQNKTIYSILSSGIHSLNEDYCVENFATLKEAIFVILDQKIRKIEDEERVNRLGSKINAINSEISNM